MKPSVLLAFRPGVRIVTSAGNLCVACGDRTVDIDRVPLSLADALAALNSNPIDENDLANTFAAACGQDWLRGHALIDLLTQRGFVTTYIADGTQTLAACEPRGFAGPAFDSPDATAKYRQSRFAYLRRDGSNQVIETPRSCARVVLLDESATLMWTRLSAAQTVSELARTTALSEATADAFMRLLIGASCLDTLDEDGEGTEDRDGSLVQWEFHDLLFHSRTRLARHGQPYGGVYPFRGIVPPPPALKDINSGTAVPLCRPDIGLLEETDITLTSALEQRRSRRDGSGRTVTARQLGEFLYRVARVKSIERLNEYETTTRVYPGGGAAYELEIYPAVRACPDLEPGLFHYRPHEHALTFIRPYDDDVAALVNAAGAMAGTGAPEVLLILAARFQRVMWKYRSMSYAGILKNVGALYQTMYLVATAMRLAPCALGGGNSDLFARVAGTDFYTETSVGEFMLNGV